MTFSCNRQEKIGSSDETKFEVFHIPDNIKTDEKFCWDEYIDDIQIIPLETSRSSVINRPDKGMLYKDQFILLDRRFNLIKNFYKDGSFVSTIGQKGKGPGEYIEVRDFNIIGTEIIILDYGKILVYNIESGSFLRSFNYDNTIFNPSRLAYFDEDNFYAWDSGPAYTSGNQDHKLYQLYKYIDKKPTIGYFEKRLTSSNTERFCYQQNGKFLMAPNESENIIYEISKYSVNPIYKMNFGTRNLPHDYNRNTDPKTPKHNNGFLESDYFKRITTTYGLLGYHYFKCMGPKARFYEGIISTDKEKVDFGLMNFQNPFILFTANDCIYGFYDAMILDAIKELETSTTIYKKLLLSYPNFDISDNPVIVKIKLKANL